MVNGIYSFFYTEEKETDCQTDIIMIKSEYVAYSGSNWYRWVLIQGVHLRRFSRVLCKDPSRRSSLTIMWTYNESIRL